MDILFLLRGIAIGFAIAAPVGPIGVLCIRRTLAGGRAAGLISGLGAATADAVYGCVAAFGLTSVSNLLVSQQVLLRAAGGVFVIYLGARTFLAPPAREDGSPSAKGLLSNYASTFVLTLTNPLTIISFAAIFAGLGVGTTTAQYSSAAMLVIGVFIGSAGWWVILSAGVGASRGRFSTSGMRWTNRIAGGVLIAFGLAAVVSSIR